MRVLVAVIGPAKARMSAILAGHHVVWADTLDDVINALEHPLFDIAVVGAQFDDSRALDALSYAVMRLDRGAVVCVRTVPFAQLGPSTFDALRAACNELGVQCVLDLLEFPDDEAGNARVRTMLERLALSLP
jgi:hypothetical protein